MSPKEADQIERELLRNRAKATKPVPAPSVRAPRVPRVVRHEDPELKAAKETQKQLRSQAQTQKLTLEKFDRDNAADIEFDKKTGEPVGGRLVGRMGELQKQASQKVGLWEGLMSPELESGQLTPEAQQAASEIERIKPDVEARIQQRRRIIDEHKRLKVAADEAELAYRSRFAQSFGPPPVAPIPPAPVAQALKTPTEKPEPEVGFWSEFGKNAADLGRSFGAGAGGLVKMVGDIYGLTADDMNNPVSNFGAYVQEYWNEGKSDELKAQEQTRRAAIDQTDGELGKALAWVTETVSNPTLLANAVGEQIPQLVPGLGAGAVTSKVAAKLLLRKAVTDAAKIAAATRLATTIGTAGGVGAGAVLQGADVGADSYADSIKRLDAMPDDQAMAIAEIGELVNQGVDIDVAKATYALSQARKTGAAAGAISLLVNSLPGGDLLERAVARRATGELAEAATGGAVREIVKGAAKVAGEATSEGLEEGGGVVASNKFAREGVDPNRPIMQGAGEAAAQGATIGAIMGVPAAISERGRGEKPKPVSPAPTVTPAPAPATKVETPVAADPFTPAMDEELSSELGNQSTAGMVAAQTATTESAPATPTPTSQEAPAPAPVSPSSPADANPPQAIPTGDEATEQTQPPAAESDQPQERPETPAPAPEAGKISKAKDGEEPNKSGVFVRERAPDFAFKTKEAEADVRTVELDNGEFVMGMHYTHKTGSMSGSGYAPSIRHSARYKTKNEAVRAGLNEIIEANERIVTTKSNDTTPKQKINARALVDQAKKALAGLGKVTEKPAEKPTYSKSSTQVTLPENEAKPFRDYATSIPEADVYTDPEDASFGREMEPHITALYGIEDNDVDAVKKALAGVGPITVKLGKISAFENEDKPFDVLKVTVDSPDLKKVNAAIKAGTKNSSDFPNYTPHLTLAYVKKGKAKNYVGDDAFAGKSLRFDSLTFSGKDGKKIEIPLTGETATPVVRKDRTAAAIPRGKNTPAEFAKKLTAAAGLKGSDSASRFLVDFARRIHAVAPEDFAQMEVRVLTGDQWKADARLAAQTPDSRAAYDSSTNTLYIHVEKSAGANIIEAIVHEAGHFAERFALGVEFTQTQWESLTDAQREAAAREYDENNVDIGADLKNDARARAEWVAMQFARVVRGDTAGMDSQLKSKLTRWLEVVRELVNKWLGSGKLTTAALDARIIELMFPEGASKKASQQQPQTPLLPTKGTAESPVKTQVAASKETVDERPARVEPGPAARAILQDTPVGDETPVERIRANLPDGDETLDPDAVGGANNPITPKNSKPAVASKPLKSTGSRGIKSATVGAVEFPVYARELTKGERFRDAAGNEHEVIQKAARAIVSQPVENGAIVRGKGNVSRWALNAATAAKYPNYRTDFAEASSGGTQETLLLGTPANADDVQRWKESLKSIEDGKPERGMIKYGRTPPALVGIGLDEHPVYMPPSVVSKATKIHGVPSLLLRTLHAAMETPVAVFKSETVDGALVVMLDRSDSQGRPMVVALRPNGQVQNHLGHVITSVYGYQNNERVARWFTEPGRALFVDKKKRQQWFQSAGLQYPGEGAIVDSTKEPKASGDVKPNSGVLGAPAEPAPLSDEDKYAAQREIAGDEAPETPKPARKPQPVPGQPGMFYRSVTDSLRENGVEVMRDVYARRPQATSAELAKGVIEVVGEDRAAALALSREVNGVPEDVKTLIFTQLESSWMQKLIDPTLTKFEVFTLRRKMNEVARAGAARGTEYGQAISAFAKGYSDARAWAAKTLSDMANRQLDNTLGKEGQEAIDDARKAVTKADGEKLPGALAAADEALKKIPISKTIWQLYRERAAKTLADYVSSQTDDAKPQTPIAEFTRRLVDQLRAKLEPTISQVGEEQAKQPTPAMDVIREAVENREKYTDVAQTARAEFVERFGADSPEVAEIDLALANLGLTPYAAKTLDRAVREAFDAMKTSVAEVAKQHYTKADRLYHDMAEAMVAVAGLKPADARQIAADLEARMKELTKQAKKDALQKLKAKVGVTPKVSRVLSAVEKAIELNNYGAMSDAEMRDVVADQLKLPRLTEDRMRKIAKLADDAETAADVASRARAHLALANELRIARGFTPVDAATAVWYANVLSGYTTQLVNVMGNVLNGTAQLATVMATNPGKAGQAMRGMLDGFGMGVKQAGAIMKKGGNLADFDAKTGDASPIIELLDYRRDFPLLERSAAGRTTASVLNLQRKALRYVFRTMRAADAIFYHSAREAYTRVAVAKILEADFKGPELAAKIRETLAMSPADFTAARQQAQAEGFEGIDLAIRTSDLIHVKRSATSAGAEASALAERFALETTYNNQPEGWAGVVANKLSDLVESVRPGGVPVLKTFLPFLRIPTNVFNASMNFTPIGALRASRGMVTDITRNENGIQVARREFNQDERARLYVQSIAGSLAMAGLAAAALGGADDDEYPWFSITATGPDDYRKRKQLEGMGWKEYSIKVGDTWVSFKDSPLLIPLALVGKFVDAKRYQKQKDEQLLGSQVVDAAVKSSRVIFETSMLSGLSQLFDLLGDRSSPQQFSNLLVRSTAGVAVPNLLNQLERTFDSTVYSPDGVGGSIGASVPFVRSAGATPRTDVLGEEIERGPFGRFGSAETNDPLREMLRDKRVFITEPSRSTKLGDRVMTPEEYTSYVRSSGEAIRRRLDMQLAMLSGLDPEQAKKRVDTITREERERAKNRIRIASGGRSLVEDLFADE